jgi:hypothetical protein
LSGYVTGHRFTVMPQSVAKHGLLQQPLQLILMQPQAVDVEIKEGCIHFVNSGPCPNASFSLQVLLVEFIPKQQIYRPD